MQILSLKLEDIKSYDQATIEFTPGANAIVGHNGAGKSTILEAIGFALFDTLPYKQADFVREGVKSGTVTVRFHSSHDDRPYEVVRRCGSSSHYYVFDPESETRILEGKADVQRFLREHLGADPGADLERLFRDAVGVPQGTLTAAFLDVAAKRNNTFDPLLQVHDYENAWQRLREPVRTMRDRLQALDVEIAGLQARLEQLPQLEEAVAARTAELTAKQEQLSQTEQELTALRQTLAQLDEAAQRVNALTRQADQTAARVAGAKERLEHAEQALAEAQAAATLVAAHAAGHAAYEAAQTQKRALDAQVDARAHALNTRAGLEAALARLQAEVAASDAALAEISAAKADVSALAGPAARHQELDDALAAARQHAARRDATAQELARSEKELARLTKRHQELSAARANATGLDAQQREVEASVAALQQAIEAKHGALQALKTQADAINKQNGELQETAESVCPVCEQPLTPEHRDAMLARNETRLAEMRRAYRAAQEELTAARAELETSRQSLTALAEEQRRLPRAQEVAELESSMGNQQELITGLKARLDELSTAAAQAPALEAERAELGDPRRELAVAQAKAQREADVTAQRARQSQEREETHRRLSDVATVLDQYAALDEQLRAVTTALATHEEAYQTVLANRRMQETLPAREEAVVARRSELAAAEEDAASAAAQLTQAQAAYAEETHLQIKAQEMQQQSARAALQTEVRLLREQNERDAQAIDKLRAVRATLEEREATHRNTAEQTEVLEHLRGVLRQAGPYVRRMVIQRISTEAAQIFGELMQDHARHLTWSEDYEISLEVDGNTRQFAQLSGGEQMSAALAVRLALLRAMSNIDVAFFDEPTSNLDETRRGALAQQITQNHGLRQLFVISHDDTFEQATENLIRVTRVNGVSEVQR